MKPAKTKTITIRPSEEDKRMVITLRKRLKTTTTGVFRQGLRALMEALKRKENVA